jgi:hypothetical protein
VARRNGPSRRSDRVLANQTERQPPNRGGDRASRAAAGVFLPTRGERPRVERLTEATSVGVFPGRTNQPERRLLSRCRPGGFRGWILMWTRGSRTKHRAITDDHCPVVPPRGENSARDSGQRSKEGRMTEKKQSEAKRGALRPTIWRLNQRTRPHNPGPARKAGRGFHRRATVEPWGGPQGSGSEIAVAITPRVHSLPLGSGR